MGIMRIGAAALVIAGGVVLAERTTTLDKADGTITGTAVATAPVSEAIGFCQRQPELCTAAATAGVAAATASLVAPSAALTPPAAIIPAAPQAPAPAAAKPARPLAPKVVQQPAAKPAVPRAAAVPLPPQRPAALGKARPPA